MLSRVRCTRDVGLVYSVRAKADFGTGDRPLLFTLLAASIQGLEVGTWYGVDSGCRWWSALSMTMTRVGFGVRPRLARVGRRLISEIPAPLVSGSAKHTPDRILNARDRLSGSSEPPIDSGWIVGRSPMLFVDEHSGIESGQGFASPPAAANCLNSALVIRGKVQTRGLRTLLPLPVRVRPWPGVAPGRHEPT
jgi:hypothetical protein